MKLEKYQLEADRKLVVFEFTSIGTKGKVKKMIQFSETNLKDYYNLGFGDKDEKTGQIDDTVITNNGDSQKVLATVAASVYAFTDKHPGSMVYAKGSTSARTRLYKMGITNNLKEISLDFEIYGLKNDKWEEFNPKHEYEAFLVSRKID